MFIATDFYSRPKPPLHPPPLHPLSLCQTTCTDHVRYVDSVVNSKLCIM